MAFGNPLDPDDDQPVPPDFVRAVRLAIGIVTERELAAALNENHRTTQGKRVTGTDVLPHVAARPQHSLRPAACTGRDPASGRTLRP